MDSRRPFATLLNKKQRRPERPEWFELQQGREECERGVWASEGERERARSEGRKEGRRGCCSARSERLELRGAAEPLAAAHN